MHVSKHVSVNSYKVHTNCADITVKIRVILYKRDQEWKNKNTVYQAANITVAFRNEDN